MDKQFDFKTIDKRMPYSVPDGFFDRMEENVMQSLTPRPAHRVGWRLLLAAAAVVAIFFIVRAVWPQTVVDDFEPVELAFDNLDADDQDYLLALYADDELMDELIIDDLSFYEDEMIDY